MKEGNKQIVKIITSLIFGSLGSSVLSFVIGLEILSKTNSALAFGGTQLIGPVVSLLLLPFAGAVVDRFEKKKIIFIAQVVSILMLVFYAFSLKSGFSVLISTYLLLIVLRLADIFLSTAYGAATIHLVDEAYLQKVRSFEQLVSAVSQIIAPIIGGIIYVLISLSNIVLLEVVCETLAAMILMMVNFHYRKVSDSHVDESQDSLLKMIFIWIKLYQKGSLIGVCDGDGYVH
ncbi:MFS transporter [Enterococcus cecorum]|uniref:MFS transporter n=1 Tax=Enterococcus cecorum TaxID=44008 RepID=UPI003F929F7E